MLGITPCHCSRLLKRYRQSGSLGMNNQSRGRTGNRLLPTSLTDQALSIIRERYRDFGTTLAREKLEEVHGLVLGKETIRRLMIKAGLWIPRRQRAPKIHQPRYRRPCTGELIQILRALYPVLADPSVMHPGGACKNLIRPGKIENFNIIENIDSHLYRHRLTPSIIRKKAK